MSITPVSPIPITRLQKTARLRLVAITDAQVSPWSQLETQATQALQAGLPALMLREKSMSDEELRPIALRLSKATKRSDALFIVNGRLDLACQISADGIHVGITGPRIHQVRERVGDEMIIGYSAHNHDEALQAFAQGADYIFYSPIFETPSKQGILDPLGLDALAKLTAQAPGPVLALGGIGSGQIDAILRAGAYGVAGIRMIFGAENPAEAVRSLMRQLDSFPS
jgi:thiamine-phosphate pyrophosphorylase